MSGARLCCPLFFCLPLGATGDGFLNRVLERTRAHISQLPDFVCSQTIERSERGPAQRQYRVKDRLHLEVTSIGGKERFAKAGGSRFDDRDLRELVTRGIVTTGGYALFLRHVVQPGSAEFLPGTDVDFDQRKARRYEFHVPWEKSGYTISVPPHQAQVGFHGSLLADLETHEVLRLEVIADEIPSELGFDRTRAILTYRSVAVGSAQFPFATEAETLAVALDGNEYRNRAELGACRRYTAESKISFASDDDPAPAPTAVARQADPQRPRQNLLVEITLDHEIAFATASPDSPFRATLAEPIRDGETLIAPAGAQVHGRVLELGRVAKPVDRYEVVLRLDAVELPGGQKLPLAAKLRDTGSAAGLIRQEKRLMPAFDKKRGNRFSILVGETGPEQAVLYWDARNPQIKKGFRMRWLTESTE
jgi:hypothetical protein